VQAQYKNVAVSPCSWLWIHEQHRKCWHISLSSSVAEKFIQVFRGREIAICAILKWQEQMSTFVRDSCRCNIPRQYTAPWRCTRTQQIKNVHYTTSWRGSTYPDQRVTVSTYFHKA